MGQVRFLRRDPIDTDNEVLGFAVGDEVVNALTGNRFWLQASAGGWVPVPNPGGGGGGGGSSTTFEIARVPLLSMLSTPIEIAAALPGGAAYGGRISFTVEFIPGADHFATADVVASFYYSGFPDEVLASTSGSDPDANTLFRGGNVQSATAVGSNRIFGAEIFGVGITMQTSVDLGNPGGGPIASTALNSGGTRIGPGDAGAISGGASDATLEVDTISPAQFTASLLSSYQNTGPFLTITVVNQGTKTFTVDSTAIGFPDLSPWGIAGATFPISGSTGNDDTYTIVSITHLSGNLNDIVVSEAIPDATADGFADLPNVLYVAGNHLAALAGVTDYTLAGTLLDDGVHSIAVIGLHGGNTGVVTDPLHNPTVGTVATLGGAATYHITAAGTANTVATDVAVNMTSGFGSGMSIDVLSVDNTPPSNSGTAVVLMHYDEIAAP